MAAWCSIMPSTSRWPETELQAEPEAVQRRWPEPKKRSPARSCAGSGVVVVLDRLRGDVVAEPLGLLVGVGVAADVDQQAV
jgi:hypothetical protein